MYQVAAKRRYDGGDKGALRVVSEVNSFDLNTLKILTEKHQGQAHLIQEELEQRYPLRDLFGTEQATEIPAESKVSFKSEVFFQSEQLLKIIQNHLSKQERSLNTACFDFVLDSVDSRWKFVKLKCLQSYEERKLKLVNSIPKPKKPSACEGDYCKLQITKDSRPLGKVGYIRDAVKLMLL